MIGAADSAGWGLSSPAKSTTAVVSSGSTRVGAIARRATRPRAAQRVTGKLESQSRAQMVVHFRRPRCAKRDACKATNKSIVVVCTLRMLNTTVALGRMASSASANVAIAPKTHPQELSCVEARRQDARRFLNSKCEARMYGWRIVSPKVVLLQYRFYPLLRKQSSAGSHRGKLQMRCLSRHDLRRGRYH
jgi:hypothetical protein